MNGNVPNEMDARKPFDIVEMVRDILGVPPMAKGLERLQMSQEELEQQRRSFAFGNCNISNPNVTRAMVDQEAERLSLDASYQSELEHQSGCCDE